MHDSDLISLFEYIHGLHNTCICQTLSRMKMWNIQVLYFTYIILTQLNWGSLYRALLSRWLCLLLFCGHWSSLPCGRRFLLEYGDQWTRLGRCV